MKIPPSGGERGVPSSDRPPAEDAEKGRGGKILSPQPPASGKSAIRPSLLRLAADLRDLISSPAGGEILDRLAGLPAEERKDALFLQLLLSRRNISLTRKEWKALWEIAGKGKEAESSLREEIRDLFPLRDSPDVTPLAGEADYYRVFRDGKGKGSLLISLDKDRKVRMLMRLEKGGRKWEFHLFREEAMEVYTDDEELMNRPPPSWEDFRRAMSGYGIFVEKGMKFLQEDSFFTDTGNREPDHLVDIVL